MEPSFADYRLPRGRHGLPPELVQANQRWRLLGACAEVLSQRGYTRTTVARVSKEAAVSKATFYRNFEDLPDCILATFELARQSVLTVVVEACRGDSAAAPALAEILATLLEFLEQEPALAHALTDPALEDVPGVSAARAELIARCASLLESTHGEGNDGGGNRRAQHLLRGMQGWLSSRLAAGEGVKRPEDLAQLLAP